MTKLIFDDKQAEEFYKSDKKPKFNFNLKLYLTVLICAFISESGLRYFQSTYVIQDFFTNLFIKILSWTLIWFLVTVLIGYLQIKAKEKAMSEWLEKNPHKLKK